MSEMVEKVARAICRVQGRDPNSPVAWSAATVGAKEAGVSRIIDQPSYPRWHEFKAEARAAIAAMREPTEAMEIAGCDAFSRKFDDPGVAAVSPEVAWRAMIDAAMKEP